MIEVREIFSVLCFCLSGYFIVDLFISGFSGLLFVSVFIFYALAYVAWPSRRNKKSTTDDYGVIDTIELIIEFPFHAIASLFRALGGFFRKAENIDMDIDLDL